MCQSLFVLFVFFVSSRYPSAQTVAQRGFVEGSAFLFPQDAPNDATRIVGDLLVRDEVFVTPAPWIQFAGGLDLRLNSHDQTDRAWRVDFSDRGVLRPSIAVRRLSATVTHKALTVDAGKQFIRWGKTDIVTPTDRFAPRDFMNVVDTEFLPVTGVRAAVQTGSEDHDTFEVVWVPRFTPSRLPLLDQRWTAVPPEAAAIPIVDAGATFPEGPEGSETGVRWSHVGAGMEFALSYFDGFNHLPNIESAVVLPAAPSPIGARIEVTRLYPAIRAYGADLAAPTRWVTIKAETAYFTSTTPLTDEYVLYVVQLERQTGEWVFVAGYAGEAVTARRAALTFAPDRGLTRSIVARASYTIDATRSVAFESAVRQSGDGVYAKGEYSQTRGQHWRATIAGVAIAGASDDFLGQYRRNSHATVALRYSF
ncbi:MAG: hypothetical protein LAO77_13755 [Acidobacteriia bacterium]|nr:hypothetical protein [Terriglobia bacterium]